ncbi:hypothetical protein FE257_010736 [Aspergillus nanangensis]|uniref:Polyadenylation factor subunit 2 n=1 Tax=Aspergillus nanangensis TaxID=2582783 RepID=A0AAD4CVD7_ASPNN|nr:hypothetical protein FE257_010736 [Aspergillus nanangensis]
MSFYDESGGDSQSFGRPPKSYEGGIIGPRRPRLVTDYGSSLVQWMRNRRPRYEGGHRAETERPSASYIVDMLPPLARPDSPADTIPVRHLHQSIGKSKKPITVVRWTPEGRRLLTGGHTGEFMLWNGTAFNFETVMDAHYDQLQAGVTSIQWSHSHDWLISGGQKGDVKYWRPNFNNVETIDDAHHDAVRDLAWSPSDTKFLSASDDTTLKIFDFTSRTADTVLTGHNWDVKSCDWHPTRGLLVSGSKDHQVKFWDPRTARCLTTLHSHKNTVTATRFSRVNSNLLATSSRDQTARVFDLRMMRDICILRGHEKPVSSLTWHPIHSNLISTGSEDGSLYHYLLDEPNVPSGQVPTIAPYDSADPANTPAQVIYPAHRVQYAHGATIWSLDWHPLGHILASGSKDNFTRFWSRTRPGETSYLKDRFHIGEEAAEAQGTWNRGFGKRQMREEEEQELQDEAESLVDQKKPTGSFLPGIQTAPPGSGPQQDGFSSQLLPGIGAPHPPPQAAMQGSMPQMDPGRLAALLSTQPPPPQNNFPPPGGFPGFPMPPALSGTPPANVDLAELQKQLLSQGISLPQNFPQGFPPMPPSMGGGGLPGLQGNGPQERSLGALLRSLQSPSELQDAFRLLPTATSLLSVLGNPLNITLLSSQLLTAPAIWDHPIDLYACRRILSVFNTAAMAILRNEASDDPPKPYGIPKKIEREAWVKAIVSGADEKSPRWRHLLLIGGVLLGFEGQNRQGLPWGVRKKLESALVTAAQLALEELTRPDGIDGLCITMVLNYSFELLSDYERSKIDYDRLLPLMIQNVYESPEGLEGAYFLGTVDKDIVEVPGKRFQWSAQSDTFDRVTAISMSPLVSALGPLSRLMAHAVENAQDPRLVAKAVDHIADFARTLMVQWRQNKLSEIDKAEESEFLDPESLKTTIPSLWRLLRNTLYSTVVVLRAILGRVLNDHALAANQSAPFLSMQALHILRNLYFISSRIGPNSSSQHMFVTLTAVDILSQYPDLAENFLRSIKPNELGQVPAHPLERSLDLYFMNTAELCTSVITTKCSEELVISAALPYLPAGGNNHLLEIFEAAHSVVLAVFAIPENAAIAAKNLPFYIDNLFAVFPKNLSIRQFRLAFKTVLQVTAPPSPIANRQRLLPSILLEVLYDRALHAPHQPLPPSSQSGTDENMGKTIPLSEQSALTLSLIDGLCFLRVEDLEEWLPLTANLINTIREPEMRHACVERFWDALSSGEMDVERAHYCVTWWSTKGGRELILMGNELEQADATDSDGPYMSGAVGAIEPERSSKL